MTLKLAALFLSPASCKRCLMKLDRFVNRTPERRLFERTTRPSDSGRLADCTSRLGILLGNPRMVFTYCYSFVLIFTVLGALLGRRPSPRTLAWWQDVFIFFLNIFSSFLIISSQRRPVLSLTAFVYLSLACRDELHFAKNSRQTVSGYRMRISFALCVLFIAF